MGLSIRKSLARYIAYLRRHRKVYASRIDKFILVLIFINGITLGMETSAELRNEYGRVLLWIDRVILAIFILEIGMKMIVLRAKFFKNGWHIFDLIIIGVSCLHFDGTIAILRCLRILRVFLLISFLPNLRFIVESLLNALQGIVSIAVLLILIYYVFGVMGTHLFQTIDPENFGDLGRSLFTLFRVMTLDSWSNIVPKLYAINSFYCLFFVTFILISTYVILNIFIAIIINGMREARIKNKLKKSSKSIQQSSLTKEQKVEAQIDAVLEKLMIIEEKISSLDVAQKVQARNLPGGERKPES